MFCNHENTVLNGVFAFGIQRKPRAERDVRGLEKIKYVRGQISSSSSLLENTVWDRQKVKGKFAFPFNLNSVVSFE